MMGYTPNADEITNALKDEPELLEFWNRIKNRDNFFLHISLKDKETLSTEDVKAIIKIIKSVEDKETQQAQGSIK